MSLTRFHTPQLLHLHSGKVRESFRVDQHTRLVVTTDRVSAFDRVLSSAIPFKGEVLNRMSAFWFRRTQVRNHFLELVDPQASLVQEVQPIRVEMIVRGFLTGSMGRDYAKGKRVFSGVQVPDGLRPHQRFTQPLLTPTTKEASDREASPQELIAAGLVTEELWERMAEASLQLFREGSLFLEERGLLLVDTKYEFGLSDGELVLMDELHTPDSSRFWTVESYERDPLHPVSLDKEYVRSYLLAQGLAGTAAALPPEVVEEASRRYQEAFRRVTGEELSSSPVDPATRLAASLSSRGLIREGFVVIVVGSPADEQHARRIAQELEPFGVFVELRACSAHRTPEDIASLVAQYEGAAEPGVLIAVAGMSNGLGGALAGCTTLPVISCPPFKGEADILLNAASSLMMPPGVAACTVVDPRSAAMAALRALNSPQIREKLSHALRAAKERVREADRSLRHPMRNAP